MSLSGNNNLQSIQDLTRKISMSQDVAAVNNVRLSYSSHVCQLTK